MVPALGCGVLDLERGALLVVEDVEESPVVETELDVLPPAEDDLVAKCVLGNFPFVGSTGLLYLSNWNSNAKN